MPGYPHATPRGGGGDVRPLLQSIITALCAHEEHTMKLDVGDIHMDSDAGIAFGEDARADGEDIQRTQALETSTDQRNASRERAQTKPSIAPVMMTSCIAGGSILAAMAIAVAVAFDALPLAALAAWGVTPLTACGAMITLDRWRRADAAWREMRSTEQPDASEDLLAQARAERLLEELERAEAPRTVDQLGAQTGWSEEAVLIGLDRLVTADRVDEDIDMETGA